MKSTLSPRRTEPVGYNRSNHVCICSMPVDNIKEINFHLFKIYRVSKSIVVKEKLLKLNQGLIKKALKEFSGYKEAAEDLFQAGSLGLMNAIDNYDYTLGFAFSTYAMPYVTGFMYRHVQKYNYTIYIPAQILGVYQKISKAMIAFSRIHGRNPSIKELSEQMPDIKLDKIQLTLKAFSQQPCSLDRHRFTSTDDGSLGDMVPHPDSLRPDYDETSYFIDVVRNELSRLPSDMAQAIHLYYVVGCKQKEISVLLDIDAKETRSLLNRGMRELKRRAHLTIQMDKIHLDKLLEKPTFRQKNKDESNLNFDDINKPVSFIFSNFQLPMLA